MHYSLHCGIAAQYCIHNPFIQHLPIVYTPGTDPENLKKGGGGGYWPLPPKAALLAGSGGILPQKVFEINFRCSEIDSGAI